MHLIYLVLRGQVTLWKFHFLYGTFPYTRSQEAKHQLPSNSVLNKISITQLLFSIYKISFCEHYKRFHYEKQENDCKINATFSLNPTILNTLLYLMFLYCLLQMSFVEICKLDELKKGKQDPDIILVKLSNR